MPKKYRRLLSWTLFCALISLLAWPPASIAGPTVDDQARAERRPAPAAGPDLSRDPTLYVVGYAHLDTQWRWDYVTTIKEYLPETMRLNFSLFEKYPHYIFNFSGANRYRLLKEYYPADYEKVKKYVAAGRWFPSGSSMEENDVNAVSAESIIRQVLYGTRAFRREFGKTSAEYMLPDCFGFPASLPSILAHCGLRGFSTQKLVWGSFALVGGPNSPEKTPAGTPFNVGLWEGPDGRAIVAALNPRSYDSSITYDLSKTPPAAEKQPRREEMVDWPARVQRNGEVGGLYTDYMYYGTGDIGGAPDEASVKLLEGIVARKQAEPGALRVVSAASDQMFLDIKPEQTDRLPRYKGDLELTNHSAGSITSQAYMKRWNRLNEVLADDAERASLAAEWLAGLPYPLRRLNDAWTLVMGGQFHDILPGTSIPKAYEYSWNDEALAMNQFAGVLTSAASGASSALDTQVEGVALVVFNPLNIEREDIVEAAVTFPGRRPAAVRVFGPDGAEVPAQFSAGKVIFPAKAPSVGWAVYDVRPAEAAGPLAAGSPLKVTDTTLENSRYRLTLDSKGDLARLFDKALARDLLFAPARLEIKTDNPAQWPAWNMDWEDQSRAPRAFVQGPARVRIVESGPARVALEVTREAEGSKFVQTIRLAAGEAGDRVEFRNLIDWQTKGAHLKAVFPLTASNSKATYNWDIGTVERSTNEPRKFEVPSHQWFDLTDESGAFGLTVLSDCKYGSDKPDDSTLRLTLLRTPGIHPAWAEYADQSTQDWGRHDFLYGLAGHAGDFRQGQTDWQGFRLNQPLVAFQSPSHPGPAGKVFSFLSLSHSRVRVLALKRAEDADEVIVRLAEMDGRPARGVRLRFAAPVVSAREVNGVEMPVGRAAFDDGVLAVGLSPFQVRTFALKLGPASDRRPTAPAQPVSLAYDLTVSSRDKTRLKGGFDSSGRSLPAEMLPAELDYAGVRFRLGPAGRPNALAARGQRIALPAGSFNRLYILAASAEGDQKAGFRVGNEPVELTVQDWSGYVGQWDNRLWHVRQEPEPRRPGEPAPPPGSAPRMRTIMDYAGLKPGFVKPAEVAWFASHRHTAEGQNEPYAYCYLFAYSLDIPPGAATLTLPDNEKVRILAVTAAEGGPRLRPAQPLVDSPER